MNIGLFTDTYFPQINGVATSVHMLTQELTKLGHNVYIFTPSDPKRKKTGENIISMKSMPCFFIKTYRIGLLYSPQKLIDIKHLNLDIIHTQTEFSLGTFGKIISKALGIPMVHTYHTMYDSSYGAVYKQNILQQRRRRNSAHAKGIRLIAFLRRVQKYVCYTNWYKHRKISQLKL